METIEKLKVLSEDSQYDLACACGTGKEDRRRRGLDGKWLYPVTLPSGGYSVLLKTLLSNVCSNDCRYCPLRSGSDIRRCSLQPEEIARLFMDYYRRKKVFGLFLSSGVIGNPDHTMDRIIAAAEILRRSHGFRGYIHLKIIPGASDAAIEKSVSLASAVSLNIETPAVEHSRKLSVRKDYHRDILRPLELMSRLTGKGSKFTSVKCTTQFIVGASDEADAEIVRSVFSLYRRLKFHRVYFSGYQKGLGDPEIPGERNFLSEPGGTFLREHRLYQTDFLIRRYGFNPGEIIFDDGGNLRLDKDPKEVWADLHPEFYPVRINSSEKEALLRVPGLGPETVKTILKIRKEGRITSTSDLKIKGKRGDKIRKYVVFE